MATDLENLLTARAALTAAMAENAGKPDYSIDGQSVSWGELMNRLDVLNRLIAQTEGPTEINSTGVA